MSELIPQSKEEIKEKIKLYRFNRLRCDETKTVVLGKRLALLSAFESYDSPLFVERFIEYFSMLRCLRTMENRMSAIEVFYRSGAAFRRCFDPDRFESLLKIHFSRLESLLSKEDQKIIFNDDIWDAFGIYPNHITKLRKSILNVSLYECIKQYRDQFIPRDKYSKAIITRDQVAFRLENSIVTSFYEPEDPEERWEFRKVLKGDDITYVNPYDELPETLRPKIEEPLNLDGVLKVPKRKEEMVMATNKSLSHHIECYIPEVEKDYLGIKYTYGIAMIGADTDITIEIDTLDDLKKLDPDMKTPNGPLTDGVYDVKLDNNKSWLDKTVRKIFKTDILSLIIKTDTFPQCCIHIPAPYRTQDGKYFRWFTPTMMNKAAFRYKKLLKNKEHAELHKKYVEKMMVNYKRNELDLNTSEKDLIKHFGNESMTSLMTGKQMTVYVTDEMIETMCKRFIDKIIDKLINNVMEEKENEKM